MIAMAAIPPTAESPTATKGRANLWQRRLIQPIKNQLIQGASARALSCAVAVSTATAIFPILGTTALIGLAVGYVFRLNQPIIHSVNFLCTPLHILLILPFVRFGEKLVGAPAVTFSIADMMAIFKNSPADFFHQYGATCLHCIAGWAVVAPFLVALLYPITLPLVRRLKKVTFAAST